MIDVIKQKLSENPTLMIDGKKLDFELLVRAVVYHQQESIDKLMPKGVTVTAELETLTKKAYAQSMNDDPDLAIVKQNFEAELSATEADIGNKIKSLILLPHSQGSIYANKIYQLFGATLPTARIVAVGTPASFVAGNGDYVTSYEDSVIGIVRAVTSVLQSNAHGYRNGDFMGHNFISIYLSADETRTQIVNKITAALNTLPICNPLLPGHNLSDFLPEGLTAPVGRLYDNARGCASSDIPEGYITFYRYNGTNSCVPNYTFAYKNAEIYTCQSSSNFTMIGSMKVDDFFKIATYTGNIIVCGGGDSHWIRYVP